MSDAARQLHMSDPRHRAAGASTDLIAVLEERLTLLVERHREALKTIDELRGRLAESQAEVTHLEGKLQASDRIKSTVRDRVGGLVERVSKLEQALAAESGALDEGPDGEDGGDGS